MPFLGWRRVDKALTKDLDRAFGGPMLLFAFLILPVLILEYAWADAVHSNPELALALHVSVAVIWVAFALEFVLKVSVAARPARYVRDTSS